MASEVIPSFKFLLAFRTRDVALVGMNFSSMRTQLTFVKKIMITELAGKTSSLLLVNSFLVHIQTQRICKTFGTEGTNKVHFSLGSILAGNVAPLVSFKIGL